MAAQREEEGAPVRDDGWCFVCGDENPHGLRVGWRLVEGVALARFQPGRHHEGWRGVVHGGILAALVDEAMAQCLRLRGVHALTGRLEIRYRIPVPTGAVVEVSAKQVSEKGRTLGLAAQIRSADGCTIFCDAQGVCIRPGKGK